MQVGRRASLTVNTLRAFHRARHFIECAECGGGYSIAHRDPFGCSTVKSKGTCSHHTRIARTEPEHRIKRAEPKKAERQMRTMTEAIEDGLYRSSMKAEMDTLEDRKERLLRELENVEEPPAPLHPSMAEEYRKRVDGLFTALQDEQMLPTMVEGGSQPTISAVSVSDGSVRCLRFVTTTRCRYAKR